VAEASGCRNTVIKAQAGVGAWRSGFVSARPGRAKPATETQPGLAEALDELVHPETRRTPMWYLRWCSKSTANLAQG
jgi:hypothetical protein